MQNKAKPMQKGGQKKDDRQGICVKCLCKENNMTKKEYYEMALGFKENGCNLF